jgi:hypothetical protein
MGNRTGIQGSSKEAEVMNDLSRDMPYKFMVTMRPKGKRARVPMRCVVIMADSTDLAWGLFRKQEGDKWDIVELAPTSVAGAPLDRLSLADRHLVGRPHGKRRKRIRG